MKAIFGKKDFDIQVLERDVPQVAPDEVLLKVLACGVCGTDLHFLRHNQELTPLGHEIAAQILECGSLVRGLEPGMYVTVEDNSFCGTCEQCKNGHLERCRNFFNMNGQSGMAEYLVVNYRSAVPYEGLLPEHACLTEPLAVSFTLCKNAGIGMFDKVAVMGGGMIGLACARLSKYMGASKVALVGGSSQSPRGKKRLDTALAMGADFAIASSDVPDTAKAVTALLGGKPDSVIVTSPPKTLPVAMDMCAYGGTVSVAGIDLGGGSKAEIDVNELVFNKLTVKATLTEPSLYFPTAIKLIKEGVIPAELLVSHIFGFEEAKYVIPANGKGTAPIVKAVFRP